MEERAQLFGGILDGEEMTVRGRPDVISRDIPGAAYGQPPQQVSYARTKQRSAQGAVIYVLRKLVPA